MFSICPLNLNALCKSWAQNFTRKDIWSSAPQFSGFAAQTFVQPGSIFQSIDCGRLTTTTQWCEQCRKALKQFDFTQIDLKRRRHRFSCRSNLLESIAIFWSTKQINEEYVDLWRWLKPALHAQMKPLSNILAMPVRIATGSLKLNA